ncbi:Uncharacterised protein [Streptococcus pneumoniae]|nr:Uncharacterised protein [Streptococcus pneumoniae]
MNYFRKRRERQAKSNSGIYCPAANRSKIQYETKEKADHALAGVSMATSIWNPFFTIRWA